MPRSRKYPRTAGARCPARVGIDRAGPAACAGVVCRQRPHPFAHSHTAPVDDDRASCPLESQSSSHVGQDHHRHNWRLRTQAVTRASPSRRSPSAPAIGVSTSRRQPRKSSISWLGVCPVILPVVRRGDAISERPRGTLATVPSSIAEPTLPDLDRRGTLTTSVRLTRKPLLALQMPSGSRAHVRPVRDLD
jgi:hypothetical protein